MPRKEHSDVFFNICKSTHNCMWKCGKVAEDQAAPVDRPLPVMVV